MMVCDYHAHNTINNPGQPVILPLSVAAELAIGRNNFSKLTLEFIIDC